jgi:hypothetical protein
MTLNHRHIFLKVAGLESRNYDRYTKKSYCVMAMTGMDLVTERSMSYE